MREKLWKKYVWSQSFCLLTTGGAPIEVIKKYIESQGKKHGTKHISSEYIQIRNNVHCLQKPSATLRFIYNRMLSDKIKHYEETKVKPYSCTVQKGI